MIGGAKMATVDLSRVWLKVAGKAEESIVDGPGLRYVLFLQGCPHHCRGCHNPQTWDPDGGKRVTAAEILADIQKNPMVRGVTLSGGEPFEQASCAAILASALMREGFHVMAYSGYTFEDLIADHSRKVLLEWLDILADGPFIESQKTLEKPFVGSKNQRLIDVPASLKAGEVVLWDAK